MKKLLLLVLSLTMVVSLCACGGDGSTSTTAEPTTEATTEPEAVILEIGEVASTDKVEFTLMEFSFGKYYADSAEEYAIVKCSIKNIGKTKLDDFVQFAPNEGSSRLIRGIMRLNYNDGFIFKDSGYQPSWDYEPLSPAVEHTVAYSVPAEVIENTDNSLLLEVVLPNEDGTMTIFTYKLR